MNNNTEVMKDTDPILDDLYAHDIAVVDANTIKQVEKLDKDGWEEMEIKYTSEHEKSVSDMLLELGEESYYKYYSNSETYDNVIKKNNQKVNTYEAIGEEYYNACNNYYFHLLFSSFEKENQQQEKITKKKSKNNKNNLDEETNTNDDLTNNDSKLNEELINEVKPKTATQIKKEKQALKDAKKAKKDTGKNNLKKEDQIKLANTINKVKELFEIIRDTENKGEGDNLSLEKNNSKLCDMPNLLINNKVLELKGLTWLLFGSILARNVSAYTTEKNLPIALSMITGMIRFIDVCKKDGNLITGINVTNRSQRCAISHSLLDHIQEWVTYLIPNYETGNDGIYPYNGITICNVARHLLATTDFPNAIPSHGISPRAFQKTVMTESARHYDKGFFFGLNPTIGVGKTSSVLSYAKFLSVLRDNDPTKKHFGIYSCDTDAVRKQVGVYCYNAHIPFAVATVIRDHYTNKFKVIVVPNRNCKYEDDAIIIICDTMTAKTYLDHLKSFEYDRFRYCTLLLDEPTNGADIKGSAMLDNVCEIFTLLPPRTMLITATLPKFEDIPNIIDHVLEKNYNCEIKTITSDEIQIGCSVYTMDKTYVTPFNGCKTKESIIYAIDVVKNNPFLSRLCTIEVVMMLWEKMKESGIQNLEDLNKTFSNPQNMGPSAVHKTCIRYLEKLAEQSDDVIEKVCSTKILTKENIIKQKNEETNEDDLFSFEDDPKEDIETSTINYYDIATKSSTKFKSQTLVAVGDPVQFCNLHFGKLYRDVINAPSSSSNEERGKFGSIKNAVRRYITALNNYNEKRESLEKNTKGSDNKSKALQDFDDIKPTLNFPKFGVINSKEHCSKYGCGEKIKSGFERRSFTLEEIDIINMQTPDWILVLLCCGIGIYAENNPMLCKVYRSAVNRLGASGRLAFVIGDDTICYGTNWPFTCVIVDETFLNVIATLNNKTQMLVKRSVNTIMQLLGRAGRYLKSWEAVAYVIEEIANMIVAYSQNKNYPQNEAHNMEQTFELKLEEYYSNLEKIHNENIISNNHNYNHNNNNNKRSNGHGITFVKTKKNKDDKDDKDDNTVIEMEIINSVQIVESDKIHFAEKTEFVKVSSFIENASNDCHEEKLTKIKKTSVSILSTTTNNTTTNDVDSKNNRDYKNYKDYKDYDDNKLHWKSKKNNDNIKSVESISSLTSLTSTESTESVESIILDKTNEIKLTKSTKSTKSVTFSRFEGSNVNNDSNKSTFGSNRYDNFNRSHYSTNSTNPTNPTNSINSTNPSQSKKIYGNQNARNDDKYNNKYDNKHTKKNNADSSNNWRRDF